MSWASSRQALILAIIGAVILSVVALVAIATFYEAPSCADNKQNQDETGIDCGGSCTYLCKDSVRAPLVSFARALVTPSGRTDIIAYVENPNTNAAAVSARYTVEVFGADTGLLGSYDGVIDLPAGTIVPLFVPGALSGGTANAQAFLSFDTASLRWFAAMELPQTIKTRDVQIVGLDAPRVTAVVENTSAVDVRKVRLIATVFDAAGNAIAASQTVVVDVSAFGTVPAVFTWNAPFSATPARIDVRPVVSFSEL